MKFRGLIAVCLAGMLLLLAGCADDIFISTVAVDTNQNCVGTVSLQCSQPLDRGRGHPSAVGRYSDDGQIVRRQRNFIKIRPAVC